MEGNTRGISHGLIELEKLIFYQLVFFCFVFLCFAFFLAVLHQIFYVYVIADLMFSEHNLSRAIFFKYWLWFVLEPQDARRNSCIRKKYHVMEKDNGNIVMGL